MLVLTRKLGQSIRITEEITVTVVRVNGNSVRLAIEAPREIPIVRSEKEFFPPDSGTSNPTSPLHHMVNKRNESKTDTDNAA